MTQKNIAPNLTRKSVTADGRKLLLASVAGALFLIPLIGLGAGVVRAAEPAVTIPAPMADQSVPGGNGTQTVVLAGGCFWGVQAVFEHTKGVTQAVSGYSGGSKDTAHYEQVGTERTGHAESVSVTYDPKQISYGKILQIYFSVAHNPTELNRQGPDSGPSYRSAIFYADDAQKQAAEAYIAELDKVHAFSAAIVTKLEPFKGFYPAEDYHQDFAVTHPSYPYIVFNDAPKVDNLKRLFPDYYREAPVTVMAANKPTQ
ncbi:MAG TPA: peptide-methionine (S)-S-oxide reductase MsrA [Xanthobacteraceae bacterium]|jgi:peptide-methionine (S)-S-oxide reductase|nr:peptide-methionine (S)-S-oxide reductase MsrA [Xanthobacteraceae bacterium]